MKAFRFLALPVHLQDLELLILPLKGGLSKLQLRESLEEGSCESNAVDLLNKLV